MSVNGQYAPAGPGCNEIYLFFFRVTPDSGVPACLKARTWACDVDSATASVEQHYQGSATNISESDESDAYEYDADC